MILARLSNAIREQNWFAVILEFVIVIAGVVVGFQITAAADRAAERERMDRALVRLQVEIEQSAGLLAGMHKLRAVCLDQIDQIPHDHLHTRDVSHAFVVGKPVGARRAVFGQNLLQRIVRADQIVVQHADPDTGADRFQLADRTRDLDAWSGFTE